MVLVVNGNLGIHREPIDRRMAPSGDWERPATDSKRALCSTSIGYSEDKRQPKLRWPRGATIAVQAVPCVVQPEAQHVTNRLPLHRLAQRGGDAGVVV